MRCQKGWGANNFCGVKFSTLGKISRPCEIPNPRGSSLVGKKNFTELLFLEDFFELFGESWDDFEDVAHYAVCGDFEDGSIGVFIYCNDDF